MLEDDAILLSDNRILLDDLSIDNISFHNGIYVTDPGSYKKVDSYDEIVTCALNMERIDEFLLSQILYVSTCHLTNDRRYYKVLKENILRSYKDTKYTNLLEFLIDDIKEENLSEYIKVKIKK